MIHNLNTLVSTLDQFASNHLTVKRFSFSFFEQFDNKSTKENTFPIFYAIPNSVDFENSVDYFSFRIYCVDILQKDRSNEQSVLNSTLLVLRDFVNWIKNDRNVDLNIISTSTATPVNNFLCDFTCGWYVDVNVEATVNHTDCSIPFSSNFIYTGNTGSYIEIQNYLTCETLKDCSEILNIKNSYLPLTGGTLSGSISATTYYGDGSNLTGINSDNFYTTGVTLSGNSLVFDRNDSINAYSVDLSSFSPDLSGYIPYTGATGFSQTMSSTTYYNLVVDSNGNVLNNNLFDISINFIDIETWSYRAPEDFKIYNIINPDGLNLTIDVNSSGYTTGDTIVYLDTLEITPDAVGFIKLNCSR